MMNCRDGKKPREVVCLCNNVSREAIEASVRGGCRSLNEIFDKTTAGVGPCGGSCRRKLQPILDAFIATGEFPPPPPKCTPRRR